MYLSQCNLEDKVYFNFYSIFVLPSLVSMRKLLRKDGNDFTDVYAKAILKLKCSGFDLPSVERFLHLKFF